jgi:capsular polysaccharide biosynthesis protein
MGRAVTFLKRCRDDPSGAARAVRRRLRSQVAHARRTGRQRSEEKAFDPAIEAALRAPRFADPHLVVVILADPEVRGRVAAWIRRFPVGTVRIVSPEPAPEWELDRFRVRHYIDNKMHAANDRLKLVGPADVIVDLQSRTPAKQQEWWRRLFFHLKPGGLYIIDPVVEGARTFNREYGTWLGQVLGDSDPEHPAARHPARELSNAVARVHVSRDAVVIEKRFRHYLKLRDLDANRILAQREPALHVAVLDRLPGGTVDSRARVTSHPSTRPMAGLEPSLDYPQLHLRHYEGEIVFSTHLLTWTGSTILPDSFRHHLEDNEGDRGNRQVINSSGDFARIPAYLRPRRRLAGNYYHVDSPNSGHFGHLVTEVLSRLWGWDEAKRAIPDLKAIFHLRHGNERLPQLEQRLFGAYGIAPEDVVWVDEPVRLDSLVGATPMWHNRNPHYVHPEIQTVWERVGKTLVDPSAPHYPKIFISRSDEHTRSRRCRNVEEVEGLFAANGFEILYPERLDLGVQAGIFANAEVIAGFGGSGLFNMMFSRNAKMVIQLAHEGYFARETHLFTSLLGTETHYFWSAPDFVDPEDDRSMKSFYSSWAFDFDRNGAELKALLADT